MFGNKEAKVKISSSTAQVLELEAQKKRLEMERDQIQIELQNQKKREGMKLEEEAHKQKLKLQEETAVFNREKLIWEKEKQELIDRAARERKEFEETHRKQSELQLQEAVTLTKLEAQQKIKQAEIDKSREVNEVRTKAAEELSKTKSELAEDYYNKLTAAFQDIQMNGDKNSKFVQELALKVFDRVPSSDVRVDVNQPKLSSGTN